MTDENQSVKEEDGKVIAANLARLTTLAELSDKRAAEMEQRMFKTEVHQETIMSNIGKLSESMQTMVETVQKQARSTTKFEQQLIAHEKRTLDHFDIHTRAVDKVIEKQDNMEGRIYILELESAGNAGKQNAESDSKKFWSDNWFKILQTLIFIITVAAAIMAILNGGDSGGGGSNP